MFFLV